MENTMNNVNLRGCFTTQRWLQGRTLREIELRLGFHQGRLSQGAWFATAFRLPKPEEFEFAGYTQVAGHRTKKADGDLSTPANQEEKSNYLKRQMSVINNEWSLLGNRRLIKVIPMLDHSIMMSDDLQYPPGLGIPQWKIVLSYGVPWKGVCMVKDYPNGRFIPEEGYETVQYI